MNRRPATNGQSTVEAVALAPVVLTIGLLCAQAFAAGAVRLAAAQSAHAAAVAYAERGATVASGAARRALPGWARGSVDVAVHGSRVGVTLRPRAMFPELSGLLASHASAALAPTTGSGS